jgi:serine/threonine protein kinase
MRSFEERLEIMINLSKGLKFIADENICHRDIKPSNVMLNNQKQPKIIDFGSSISAFNQKVIIVSNEQLCSTKGYYFPY